jgi:hypothetical protein
VERTVLCADAIGWLVSQRLPADHAVLTSLPDVSELSLDLSAWQAWFVDTAALVVEATHPRSAAVFYQTDIKRDGVWIDKAYLVQRAAERAGAALLWHKIVCRAPAGVATFGRPAYAHMVCVSRELRADVARSTADVLPRLGEMTWARAMGREAAEACVDWLATQAGARVIVDPFCGVGTALAVANARGLGALGVERSPKRAARARLLV